VLLEAESPTLAAQSAELIRGWTTTPPNAVGPPWDALLRSAKVAVDGRRVFVRVDVTSLAAGR
jgi:hypothetical protein